MRGLINSPDFLVFGTTIDNENISAGNLAAVFLFRGDSGMDIGVNPGAILVSRLGISVAGPGSNPVAGRGDLNGDELPDIVVGDHSFGPTERGQFRIYTGRPFGLADRVVALLDAPEHIYEEEGVFTISATALIEGVDGVSVALQIVNVLSSGWWEG